MSLLVVIILVSPLNNFKATVPNTSHSKDIYYVYFHLLPLPLIRIEEGCRTDTHTTENESFLLYSNIHQSWQYIYE